MDKQIEEMAKVYCQNGFKCGENCQTNGCRVYEVCTNLYNAGYRKIPEGTVVLTEKEYKRYERIEETIRLAKMYKALGYEVKNGKLYYFSNLLDGCEIEFKDLQEICDMANHYLEEFCGLAQRLTFWKAKAEEIRKETAEKYHAEINKVIESVPNATKEFIEAWKSKNDEICKEITEKGVQNGN